ncbi:MAG: helix-turn-helix transcriptional regulator [Clostridia bacterium]|nr:helix-turn-helix transcriptional regulator [Clostridia bacterium]
MTGSRQTEYAVKYCGSDIRAAEKALDEGSCCAIIYCREGYGVAYLMGERAEISAGCCIALILRGNSQGITISEDFAGQFLICSGSLCNSLFGYYLGVSPFKLTDRTPFIKQLSEPTLYQLHGVLDRVFCEKRIGERSRSASVEAIKSYIDEHTDKKITLDELSRLFFISKTQIFRLFTGQYGIPPMRYMLSRKIEVSKEMLTSTDMRISEIAEALCFTDSKHFTKTFRAFTGMLPREYRQKLASK